ncbi:hypothetical protein N1027_06500 [Herbiconiux sp. CPCC 205763]|uniref:Uncharacterized protein n=1 Tax=Herbiconiux aconitum TaxID=2970913 RepID=A0ABT2GNM3_9MICO|nr:hypothetical protein [Herbiconiux aconitum]MCS5717783.1 hypothetical protein [Herbiconiux aconitum]
MESAPMRFAGFLPEDAPDPRLAQSERVKLMPVPVMGFIPQPSLDDVHMESTMSSQGESGMSQMAVSINYTLWRNPLDRSDPVNLADLDESTRRALDVPTPHLRPAWLIEQVKWMRYPMLWEAVRTAWHRDPTELSTPSYLLVEHANHILMNRFRKELGLGDISTGRFAARLTERAVNPRATAVVEGIEVPAMEIDTDPFVYAIGVELAPDTVLTAVIPRDELQHVNIEFAQRVSPTASAPSP